MSGVQPPAPDNPIALHLFSKPTSGRRIQIKLGRHVMSTQGRQLVRAVVALGASAALVLPLAGTATAVPIPRNGLCEAGEFCLYWGLLGPDGGSSVSDFNTSIPEYGNSQPGCYDFKGPGKGKGECVKNNAASAYNRTTGTVRLYNLPSCVGAERWVLQPGELRNDLTPHIDKNQSHSVASSGAC
jgi:hypothetical protein